VCDCGNTTEVKPLRLRTGWTKSCGCLRYEGGLRTEFPREYAVHQAILQRCNNPKNSNYCRYGGRGIFVCERWAGPDGFANFMEDMGPRPKDGLQIDRANNSGGYEKSNCHWVTSAVNNRNRRNNVMLTHDGITLCMADWDKRCGFGVNTIRSRLTYGWTVSEAIETPVKRRNRRSRNTAS
jgi:hypothetical protein